MDKLHSVVVFVVRNKMSPPSILLPLCLQDLIQELKSETSGSFRECIVALMEPKVPLHFNFHPSSFTSSSSSPSLLLSFPPPLPLPPFPPLSSSSLFYLCLLPLFFSFFCILLSPPSLIGPLWCQNSAQCYQWSRNKCTVLHWNPVHPYQQGDCRDQGGLQELWVWIHSIIIQVTVL